MKVLLTGATGFVGSHILDALVARGIPALALVRRTSNDRWIRPHTGKGSAVERREGGIEDPASLRRALAGASHVIHCAGATRARGAGDFYAANQQGTRNVVDAVNAVGAHRLLLVSSLAAFGPGTVENPARETLPPRPVSEYGKSKLAGEEEVRSRCQCEHVIVRPPAVYGPRDEGFLPLFRSIAWHIRPRTTAGQDLSLVYVQDLVEAVLACLTAPGCAGRTYFAACSQPASGTAMALEIARQMETWTVPCPLPLPVLWTACAGRHLVSRFTGRPEMLNLYKFPELRAPGWVCDSSALLRDTGIRCGTELPEGVARTLRWYREQNWL